MEVFNFCWLTLLDESKKSSVFFDKNTCNVRNDIDENFNKPVTRISYLYKFGSYNISFFHQCFKEFSTKAPDSSKIINNFLSKKNLIICSMSVGPGTDIVGLLYSLHLINKPLVNPATFKVICRYGSWRNLVDEMISSSIINVPDTSTCKLLECDYLKKLSDRAKGYLRAADIVLMCNSFSSSVAPGKMICNALERIHQLKPGALVFFIVSEEKSAYLKKLDSFGSFLYGPVEVTFENMPYNEEIAELVGVKPLCSGKSLFAVWQSKHKVKSKISSLKKTGNGSQSSSAKIINSKSDIKGINSKNLDLFNLNREFSSDINISSSDSIASSSRFSSSSISNQIMKRKEPVASDNSSFIGHTIGFPESNFNFAKNISPASVNTTDSLLGKKHAQQSESGPKKKEKNEKNMDSLLKNFEGLIKKLEGFVISQEKQYSSGQHCHQDHCKHHVKPCLFNTNGSSCCCHSVMSDTNARDHNCSTSVASNLYRSFPQEGPCVVIPLQNLSNESLIQILSIVSQNHSGNGTSTSNPEEKDG